MQGDLISRSAAIDAINKERRFAESLREITYDNEDRAHNTGELGCAIRLARKIKELPALDVAPVVHARWIDESKEFEGVVIHSCRCSACGKNPLYRRDVDYTPTHIEVSFGYDQSNFCPNWGARMDGDAE